MPRQIDNIDSYVTAAWELLQRLIAIPSYSRAEAAAATFLCDTLTHYGLSPQRINNNIYCLPPALDPARETILLNAHIDTVRPVASWQRDPHTATLEGDTLYGLGSNDCGGGLVALTQVFRILCSHHDDLDYNVILLLSAEEEVSGRLGIAAALPLLPPIDVAIIGEPTSMQPAIAEKGLMVIDLEAHGRSGHAARNDGDNAIYKLVNDINWIRSYTFPRVSTLLGATVMQVTQVSAGTQHNVIPDRAMAVIDVRTNELYTNEEVFQLISTHCQSTATARSFRLKSSFIAPEHPLIRRCIALGGTPFGSPTLSDQALLSCPSFKLGPGDSRRSHTADEFITLSELRHAIDFYLHLLS